MLSNRFFTEVAGIVVLTDCGLPRRWSVTLRSPRFSIDRVDSGTYSAQRFPVE
jgi:hypothetical protein